MFNKVVTTEKPGHVGSNTGTFFPLCHSFREFVSSLPYDGAIESLMKKNQQPDCLKFISSPDHTGHQSPFDFEDVISVDKRISTFGV